MRKFAFVGVLLLLSAVVLVAGLSACCPVLQGKGPCIWR